MKKEPKTFDFWLGAAGSSVLIIKSFLLLFFKKEDLAFFLSAHAETPDDIQQAEFA